MRILKSFCPVLVTVLCLVLVARSAQARNVVISEIMYHPPSTNELEQWFELLNNGSTNVNLSGWRVTKGVNFAFPTNTTLPPGAYLVVAADPVTFTNHHPGVMNFVAGWMGSLGHAVEISDAAGNVIDSVEFFSDGDWAPRILGVGGAPGALDDFNGLGWEWFALHDGFGASLELVNPDLPGAYAHNWGANRNNSSTPGRANSIASTNTAPFIAHVTHLPVIPQPSDPVTITARIVDEQTNGLTVTLHWRLDGAANFNTAVMFDDGAHGDGLANDGIFGVILPAQANTTIVEFYLVARDSENNVRTYPSWTAPAGSTRTANLLYQVDDGTYSGSQPVYRMIMTEAERNYLQTLSDKASTTDSDAAMNATWITSDGVLTGGTTTQLRYNIGVRNRGHGTRLSNPHNFHLNIPNDRAWKNQSGINLNAHYAYSQVLGSAVFRNLEVPMADARGVQLRVNSTNQMALPLSGANSFGSYTANEQYNNDFIKRTFPLDPRGNSYRCIRDPQAGVSSDADLSWHGANYAQGVYTNAYFKENNLVPNDWSDLIRLMGVLNEIPGYSTTATYVTNVQSVLDVDEWMRYMAINTLFDNNETCLANGAGDDYALYRGTNDTRFLALPYDADTLMGRGLAATAPSDGLFRMNALPAMDRFMKTPEFAPRYYYWLRTLADGAFSPALMNPLLDQLFIGWVPQANIDNMKSFNASRVSYVLSQIPLALAVTSALPMQNGYPRTTTATVALNGQANAIDTRTVRVNGTLATYSAWEGRWTNNAVTLHPGINRVLVQAFGAAGIEVGRATYDVWYDDATVASVSGAITSNTSWTAADGPYRVIANLTVNSGATLTIQAGASVYLSSGVNLTVANGGRLLAEGTSNAPIRFTRAPTDTANWGGITINGGAGTPETRITYTRFEFNGSTAIHSSGGTLFLDHLSFGNTAVQYVSLDSSSFVVSHCVFPNATAQFEGVHGSGGIKAGGRGIFYKNFHGLPIGYNDVIDFTGGNRPGGPIVQFLDCVFIGASDDILDIDGTDAWIEGNIFLHTHKNGSPDSASAVSGGDDSGNTSEITIINNLFYDLDQAATAKIGNFYTFINNTVVRQTKVGGLDTDAAVLNFADDGTAEAAGMYVEGNIIYDAEKLTRHLTDGTALARATTFTNNLMPFVWAGPGGGNSTNAPLLKHIPQLSETSFNSWEEAQVMRDWFSLLPGSPAIGTGPNGTDLGGVRPLGASISGEPAPISNLPTATLTVGINRSGHSIPAAGWPAGSGYTHYKWRLDGGAWSAETPIATAIRLSGLANGTHRVDVTGKRDSGMYQDDPQLGEDAVIAQSRSWVVDLAYVPPATPTVRLNEVLASNATTLNNAGTTPDLIELFNYGPTVADLSGMGLSDNATLPYKFVFPANTTLEAGAYLTLYADSASTAPGTHLGFSVKQNGDGVFLTAGAENGSVLLDSVIFGVQLTDYSVGRGMDGAWVLCRPTFGAANNPLATGSQRTLRINEWMADAQFVANNDFVELYNADPLPVALGGLFLSDASGSPTRHPITPLSFIAGGGFARFIADSDPGQGADHLNFKLPPDVGLILLSAADLTTIDVVTYGPQRTDVSEGRSPNGGSVLTFFAQATPGGGNPGAAGGAGCTVLTETVNLMPIGTTWRFNQTSNLDGVPWFATNYSDAGWPRGPALLSVEDCGCLPAPGIQTPLTLGEITYYFRGGFVVDTNLAGFALNIRAVIDDGAIVYLNGTELFRVGMPGGSVVNTTPANRTVGNGSFEFFTAPISRVREGTNTIAVEVHQVNSTSSDITFGLSVDASRSSTNCDATIMLPVVLNEVSANSRKATDAVVPAPDWVELFNTSTNALDLADASLTDDPTFPRKWSFPAGSTIPAREYSVIYFDNSAPPSATNTGFRLAANGGAVFLFDNPAGGGALVDGLTFGLQTPGFAIGRVPTGTGNWTLTVPTLGAVNTAAALASPSALRINEWMADPSSGSDWFEIYNTASQPVALGGLHLTDALTDRFQSPIAPLSFIGTGGNGFLQFIADGVAANGPNHVNFSLKKAGEAIGIYSPTGVQLDAIGFGLQTTGVSQGRLPDGSATLVSFPQTASPETSNWLSLTNAVINEVLTHTDPPLEDAIELFNPSDTDVNLGGWYLSNSGDNLKKHRIPDNTILPAHGFVVFYETNFNGGATPFTLNSAHGDQVILAQADALGALSGFRVEASFGAAENGVSLGRYQTSMGVDFTAMSSRTFGEDSPATLDQFRLGGGLPNAGPKVGPVVISEIMFHPTVSAINPAEAPEDEFIELQNITTAAVPLFDTAFPTNTWRLRDAVDFDFPTGLTLGAGERALVVGFSPTDAPLLASFRAKYSVPPNVPVFGPWSGRLDNNGDSIELVRPDAPQMPPHPDAGFVPRILVDKVKYSPTPPWPNAYGNGLSLQRITTGAYGNDPVNWFSAVPSAGAPNTTINPDSDGDGMPDAWELANFGTLARDGSGDFDSDGVSDLNEYLSGTNPDDPNDYLRILSAVVTETTCVLTFNAVAGGSYSVFYREAVDAGVWTKLADVPAHASTGLAQVFDTHLTSATRYYRLVTPAQ